MTRILLVTFSVTVTLAVATAESWTPLDFGMDRANAAFKAVCWFEHLKIFPKTTSDDYSKCANGADHIVKEVQEPSPTNKKYFKRYPEKLDTWFGERVPTVMGDLPSDYSDNCNQYLKTPNADPPADEGAALNDGGNDYPYKAFAYCLMQTLRSRNGDSAIEAVKNEITVKRKHWMTALLERENEFRARHGVEPLTLNKKLIAAAQGWAETNAEKCDMYHSEKAESQYKGANTGESLSAGYGDNSEIAAYEAADGWYEEINAYPFSSGGYTTKNDALFEKIGHFTQSVWKGSKEVGYGYKFNKNCDGTYNRYVAARYYPAGNMEGAFPDNVVPPTDNKEPTGA